MNDINTFLPQIIHKKNKLKILLEYVRSITSHEMLKIKRRHGEQLIFRGM